MISYVKCGKFKALVLERRKMDKTKDRKLLPDILRGFAIALVVLGHCIQEGSGIEFKSNTMYFSDQWYQFIYSFHMPLFMLISGYFAWDSMERAREKKEQWKLLEKRSISLLIPIFGWTCFDYIRCYFEYGTNHPFFWSVTLFIKNFILSFLTNAWFLWAVFWCFLIVFFMHYYFKDSILLYVAGFLTLFIIPDGLGLGAYKYMMPYFITAFYFRGWQKRLDEGKVKYIAWIERINYISDWIWIIGSGIIFAFLFIFFEENSFIYLSGYKLIGKNVLLQLGIDCYRMLIGFAGSGFFILLWRKVKILARDYTFPVLSALGKNSLGIYMISGYLILQAGDMFGEYFRQNHFLNTLEAVLVLFLSLCITVLLKRIPIIRWLVGR